MLKPEPAQAGDTLGRMQRPDETWHRLREWTGSQASSEQLAAHVLLDAGYADVDPTHPHGGPDGGKDATATKDGKRWIMAVYFPIGQVSFSKLQRKFKADFAGVRANGVDGMVFVTNQALTDGQRRALREAVDGPADIFHLDRLVVHLDGGRLDGARERLLFIDRDERERLDELERRLRRVLAERYRHLSTHGLPRDLRRGEPRLPMDEVFVPLRLLLPAQAHVPDVLEQLSYRERRVLELRLGLDGSRGRTLEEMGRIFNVTRERIRMIESQALKKVQGLLSSSRPMATLGLELDLRATVELLRGRHDGVPALELVGRGRLVVLGGPGSGKSTLTRYLTWAMASGQLEGPIAQRLPLRVAARELADALRPDHDLSSVLVRLSGETGPAVRRALESGTALVMVDGLDEVTDPRDAMRVQDSLGRMLCDPAYDALPMLITSRMVGFHPEGPLAAVPAMQLAPLDSVEVERFLRTWFAQVDGADAPALTERLLRRLAGDSRMADLASSPLLLTVLALLQSRGRQLPNERAQLYAAATETLIESWPAAQRGAELSLETIPLWLAPLAERAFLAPPSTGTAQEEVVEVLADSRAALFGEAPLAARERTRALLAAIERDSGLLSVTGLDENGQPLWDFLHRSFAEYLVARQRADRHRRGEEDLMELADREPWRDVLLMALGELGRRDPQAVSAVLERLKARDATAALPELAAGLRLALSALGRDVPCEQSTARSLLDTTLKRWTSTPILPLAEDLGQELRRLADTRYATLLAQAATAAALPPGRALELATALPPELRASLLEPVLSLPGERGDRAAALLLPLASAQARLASRLAELDGPHGVRMAAALEPWQGEAGLGALVRLARCGDDETSELALRALSHAASAGAIAAMESVLDLDPLYLRPVVERLAREPGGAARARAWLRPGAPQAPAALEVLRQRGRLVDPEVAELVSRLDPHLRLQALSGDEQEQARVERAFKELADPASAARVWAASVLVHERDHAEEARGLLYELADSSDPGEQVAALSALAEVDSQRAADGAGEILAAGVDEETRSELVYVLTETVGYGGDEVMARLLGDPDGWTAYTAASELLRVGDRRAVQPLIAMARVEGSFAEPALRALLRHASQLRTDIRRLLSLKRLANQRLGARLLVAGADAALLGAAEQLLGDPDATVRTAAAYALAFGADARRPEAMAGRVGPMLADTEPIHGPDLVSPDSMGSPAAPKPARCMADVAYRLLAEHPGLAEAPA
jgi:hypothetical protein